MSDKRAPRRSLNDWMELVTECRQSGLRLTAQGSYRWPRDKSEVRNLTWREFDWLMSGIDIEQPKAIKTT